MGGVAMLFYKAEGIMAVTDEKTKEDECYYKESFNELIDTEMKHDKRDYTPIKEVLTENLAMIDKAVQIHNLGSGLSTGFEILDDVTSGLHKSDLIIVAGRPAMGKTAFALNIVQNAAVKTGASALIFSLDLSREEIGNRLLSLESRVEIDKLDNGSLNEDEWNRINVALDSISKADIYIDDTPGISILEMKKKCTRLKAEKGLDLIVIDYLQLINTNCKTDSSQQNIYELMKSLKLLAIEMDCPVIVLSQLSRAPENRQDHRPHLNDLKESRVIRRYADMIMLLYRDSYYHCNLDKQGRCEVYIEKNRNRLVAEIELIWINKYAKFSDMV